MRKCIVTISLLLCSFFGIAQPVGMMPLVMAGSAAVTPIAIVVTVGATGTGGTSITTAGVTTTGATLLFAQVHSYGAVGAPTVSDSKGNTWTQIRTDNGGSFARSTLFYCNTNTPTVGTSHTFTATLSGGYASINVITASGTAASPLDQQNGGTGASTTGQPGSITPSANNCIVISGVCESVASAVSVNSGMTISNSQIFGGGTNFTGGAAYIIQTTATAINPTWTFGGTSNFGTNIVSFKQ